MRQARALRNYKNHNAACIIIIMGQCCVNRDSPPQGAPGEHPAAFLLMLALAYYGAPLILGVERSKTTSPCKFEHRGFYYTFDSILTPGEGFDRRAFATAAVATGRLLSW